LIQASGIDFYVNQKQQQQQQQQQQKRNNHPSG
jgi:hypothetical protein